jgi:hypothetical protein
VCVVVVFFLLASVRIYSLSLFIHVSFTSPSYPNSIIIPFENEAIRPFPSSSLFLSSLSQFFFVYTIYFSSSATKSCHRVGFGLVFCFLSCVEMFCLSKCEVGYVCMCFESSKVRKGRMLRIGRKEQADRPSEGHLRVRLSPKPGRTVGLSRACDPGNSN